MAGYAPRTPGHPQAGASPLWSPTSMSIRRGTCGVQRGANPIGEARPGEAETPRTWEGPFGAAVRRHGSLRRARSGWGHAHGRSHRRRPAACAAADFVPACSAGSPWWASHVSGKPTDRACRASHAAPRARNCSGRAEGARKGCRRIGTCRVQPASRDARLGSGVSIATMGSMGMPTHSLASWSGPRNAPARGAIGVEGNGGVSAGRDAPSDWTQSTESDPGGPRGGVEEGTRESAPCAAARTTEAPEAETLHVRDCAGGAGQPAFLPQRCLFMRTALYMRC